MKRLFPILLAAAIAAAVTGCYDDTALQTRIDGLEERVGTLEDQMLTANSNISSLWELVRAIDRRNTVTSIDEYDGGYVINFSNGTNITIKNGVSPKIGVKKDTDGIYYWTLNGDWLLDDAGDKLRVTGEDGAPGAPGTPGTPGTPGEDAIAPQLDIIDGYWYISTDGGVTWKQLYKATGKDGTNGTDGEDGDSFFKSVTWDAAYLYVTLADGTELTLSRGTYGIRQLAVIPDYSDGSVKIAGPSAAIRFDVRPASASASLRDLPADNYNLNVAYTMTKSAPGDEVSLPVTEVTVEDGRITVTVDASALDESFLKGSLGASANLTVTYDKFNQVMSGYFPLYHYDKYHGHGFVELGLSVKWATCNIGASMPEEYGDYFAWGETEPKYLPGHSRDNPCADWKSGVTGYNWASYKWMDHTVNDWMGVNKYTYADHKTDGHWYSGSIFLGDNKDGVEHKFFADYDYEDDAARVNWGGTWRMPTEAEIDELRNECDWEWTENYKGTGIKGMIVKSKVYESNKIFLPAGSYRDKKQMWTDILGGYWGSCTGAATAYCAVTLVMDYSFKPGKTNFFRSAGMTIRPVIDYDPEELVPGTLKNPYTPAQAREAVKDLTWTSNIVYESTGDVYVKGKISKISDKGTFTEGGTYGNASFYISEDGLSDDLYCFRILYLGNKKFGSGQTDIKVGDEVIIRGKLMNYKGTTPETVSGKAYLYSLNGKTE